MRIAVFDDLPDGGARQVVYEQVKRLSKGHAVLYASNMGESDFDFEKAADEVVRFDLAMNEHAGMMRPLKEMSLLTWLWPQYRHVSATIEAFGADVTLVHPSQITQAPILLHVLKTPSVYYGHEWLREVYEVELYPLPGKGITKRYEALRRTVISGLDWTATKRADKVVVNSAFTKHHFQQAYREKAEVIYPGVDGSVYYPANHTQKGYFLFVGEKETINGFDLVQKVLERSAIPFKVRYVTLADGKFRYTSAQLNQLYQQAVATLCLSYNEPFGLSAIESMAAGTPVIAVNEGGYRESVRDKETGILIERKAQELYTAMKYLAVETEKRKLWGTQARERVESSFTWKQHMQRLEAVLGEVIL